MAAILVKSKGRDGAIDYCKSQVDKYERKNKELESMPYRINDVASNKIMVEFYLAVSLMIQTFKSQSHGS